MIDRTNGILSRFAPFRRGVELALCLSIALMFFTTTARAADDAAAAAAPGDAAAKPLASEELGSGATLDVVRLDRHGDGLISLEFRFRNPGKEKIKVVNWDAGRDLPGKLYLIDEAAKSKYTVAKVKSSSKKGGEQETLLASRVPMVDLEPGQSQSYWAKFAGPAELSKVTLYFPDAPPIENLAISAAPTSAPAADAGTASASAATGSSRSAGGM